MTATRTARAEATRRRLRGPERRLVSLLAHEVRAPLASIRSYAALLLDAPPEDPAEHRLFLATIAEEAERLTQLLSDLVDIERLEHGVAAGLAPEGPVDLVDVAHRAAALCEPLAMAKDVHLTVELPAAPVYLPGDARLLERAFTALIENAIKFSELGGPVQVSLAEGQDSAALRVDDEGIGVPAAASERIFEMFFQAATPPDTVSPRGSGVGLTLAARVAARHAGSLSYAPRPRGSTFTLTLGA